MYEVKEEEGLHRFDQALTKQIHEYQTIVPKSEQITELNKLINDTNKKLQMKFKREHKYELLKHEEQLYKEVMYDMRPEKAENDEIVSMNPLKK